MNHQMPFQVDMHDMKLCAINLHGKTQAYPSRNLCCKIRYTLFEQQYVQHLDYTFYRHPES